MKNIWNFIPKWRGRSTVEQFHSETVLVRGYSLILNRHLNNAKFSRSIEAYILVVTKALQTNVSIPEKGDRNYILTSISAIGSYGVSCCHSRGLGCEGGKGEVERKPVVERAKAKEGGWRKAVRR